MENSMKITAGLGSIDEYERFVQAGADEFFCGYVPLFLGGKIRHSNAVKSQGRFSAVMFSLEHTVSWKFFPGW